MIGDLLGSCGPLGSCLYGGYLGGMGDGMGNQRQLQVSLQELYTQYFKAPKNEYVDVSFLDASEKAGIKNKTNYRKAIRMDGADWTLQ